MLNHIRTWQCNTALEDLKNYKPKFRNFFNSGFLEMVFLNVILIGFSFSF